MYIFLGVWLLLVVYSYLSRKKDTVGFLHPNCNAAGGGEKVLWKLIHALLSLQKMYKVAVFTVDSTEDQKILQKIKLNFDIDLLIYRERIQFVRCSLGWAVKPFPRLTMLMQILGDFLFGAEALFRLVPQVMVDTTGLPFSNCNKAWCWSVRMISYVHYPFISKEMIQKVKDRRQDFNNKGIGKSWWLTWIKVMYYKVIMLAYKSVGWFVWVAWTNSSWTHQHMKQIWGQSRLHLNFPPCSVYKGKLSTKRNIIISFAQFRPEKNHELQLRVFEKVKGECLGRGLEEPILRIMGSCRNEQDYNLLEQLKARSKQLGITVQFLVNLSYDQVVQKLKQSSLGIHTMNAEHFGITIVQMLSFGIIVVAHNSAGPKKDIIQDQSLLALDQPQYVQKLIRLISMDQQQVQRVRQSCLQKTVEFGEQRFLQRSKGQWKWILDSS